MKLVFSNYLIAFFRRQYERNSLKSDAFVIPTQYQIGEEISAQYDAMRTNFLTTHKAVASSSGFACTFDFSQSGPDYGVLTIHYIDKEW